VETADFKKYVENLVKEKAPGPSTTFSMFHIFSALELLAQKPIGRTRLAEQLGVGEGAIRTIVHRLQDADLVATAKEGMRLTKKGTGVWRKFEDLFPQRAEIEQTELTHSAFNYAFLVKNSSHKIGTGIDQRDAAIMGGAKRAISIACRDGHLVIDSVSGIIEKAFPDAAWKIQRNLKTEENDVIIIAGADTLLKAKRGAFAAAWVLIGSGEKAAS
jgi:predicted transcriptional regulator